jgi:hypothetical protein
MNNKLLTCMATSIDETNQYVDNNSNNTTTRSIKDHSTHYIARCYSDGEVTISTNNDGE